MTKTSKHRDPKSEDKPGTQGFPGFSARASEDNVNVNVGRD